MIRKFAALTAIVVTSSCSNVPAFDLTAAGPKDAPAGPKIAALIANLKCELYQAANDDSHVIPRYFNDPGLARREDNAVVSTDRRFTLKNLFQEIEYVGEAQLQLDATSTVGSSPSTKFVNLGAISTPLTLSADGSLSEGSHRVLTLFSSMDFERLVRSPPHKDLLDTEGPAAHFAYGAEKPSVPCGEGRELGGTLGIQEMLMYYFMTADMNDISVWPTKTPSGTPKIANSDLKYSIGQIQTIVDFTITSGVKGGPSWVIDRFTGPNSSDGLLNYKRIAKDQLTLTFIPICIRQKYKALNKGPRFEYDPELVDGTPRWANYLPPCTTAAADKAGAVAQAHTLNILRTSPLLLPQ
ncbi:hypothetical protein [Mesorhizobium argentiipisi]|uniref:Lipoprotein n=1 Tax=Mesorhizobium argentiipisi TaxID=3015175 RepID=A0ABU8K9F6_9HYPH